MVWYVTVVRTSDGFQKRTKIVLLNAAVLILWVNLQNKGVEVERNCPKCGYPKPLVGDKEVDNRSCPKCGVIYAKINVHSKSRTFNGPRYNVYYHPVFGYEVIKPGFSWLGFWFGPVWLLIKKMFAAGILGIIVLPLVLIAIKIVFDVITSFALSSELILSVNVVIYWCIVVTLTIIKCIAMLLPSITYGINSNKWIIDSLIKKGYRYVDSIEATSAMNAVKAIANKQSINNT